MDYEKYLECVCYIVGPNLAGGGVCIHETGIFVTTYHVVKPKNTDNTKVKLRMHKEVAWREVQVCGASPQADVAILILVEPLVGTKMKSVVIPEAINVDRGDPLVAFSHSMAAPFTICSAVAAFPFPADTYIPDVSNVATLRHPTDLQKPIEQDMSCIKQRYYISSPDKYLHPELPLLKVFGMPALGGSFGCPVFSRNGVFLGLGSFSPINQSSILCIPSPVICKILTS